MATELITENVWHRLTTAAKRTRRPTFAAVAYLGKAASRLLPLASGSRLVVDASPTAVAAGQTCPSELKVLTKRGVRIFSVQNLHAKLFVLGNCAYVGSANASHHSAEEMLEAVVAMTDPQMVIAARAYVRHLCQHELGPKELARLQKIYRPPQITGGGRGPRRRKLQSLIHRGLPPLRVVKLSRKDPPSGFEEIERAGERVARRRLRRRRTHVMENFWWIGECPYREGNQLVQVIDEGNGRKLVSPPGVVIHIQSDPRGKRRIYVFLEVPRRRRKSLARLARQLGYGAKKQLSRAGWIRDEAFAEKIRTAWEI